jgi:hypothetical protein
MSDDPNNFDPSALLAQMEADAKASAAPAPPAPASAPLTGFQTPVVTATAAKEPAVESSTAENPDPKTGAPAVARKERSLERDGDILGLGWLHGELIAAVFRGKAMVSSWTCPTKVRTMDDLEAVLDDGLTAVDFAGTETFLVLEHEQFVHQTESGPAFSDAAARSYLKGRIARYEKEHEPMLWVAQQTVSVKQDNAFIIHLLPHSFYDALQRVLLPRHLDLTRILPMTVPLHRELNRLPVKKEALVLMAVETGNATTVTVGRVGGLLLFSRTVLASMTNDPARVGTEVNRSLLYVKQTFSTPVERIWLLGKGDHSTAEVRAKCGAGKQIMVLPSAPVDWLHAAHKLAAGQPINLLANYLRQKRRQRLVRRLVCALCWAALGLVSFNSWTAGRAWKIEQRQMAVMRANETTARAERDRLVQRNADVERKRLFIKQVIDDRLPPVAARLAAYLASIVTRDTRLTDFTAKWEGSGNRWNVHIEGLIEADEETARETLSVLQKTMAKSALRVRFNEAARALVAQPPAIVAGVATPETHRFSLEGVLED